MDKFKTSFRKKKTFVILDKNNKKSNLKKNKKKNKDIKTS